MKHIALLQSLTCLNQSILGKKVLQRRFCTEEACKEDRSRFNFRGFVFDILYRIVGGRAGIQGSTPARPI